MERPSLIKIIKPDLCSPSDKGRKGKGREGALLLCKRLIETLIAQNADSVHKQGQVTALMLGFCYHGQSLLT